jgi:phosphoesterase RecJ-like protein
MIEEQIYAEIVKANSILLHLHPSPDCDSQGSALAMYHALTGLGKKVTVIKGDSDLDPNMAHLPGAEKIIPKNFLEINQKEFDLFIVQDTGDIKRITSLGEVVFAPHLKTIVIDHHASNGGFANLNLVDQNAPATALMLFRLFKKWGIPLTNEIARNLLIGIYTDTGNLVYPNTTKEAMLAVVELRDLAPEFAEDINKLHKFDLELLRFESLAYRKIERVGEILISSISLADMKEENIDPKVASASYISSKLRNVRGIEVAGCIVEDVPDRIKCSFRSQNIQKYDLSVIVPQFGGGGHKMAAGALIKAPFAEAKARVLSVINQYTK